MRWWNPLRAGTITLHSGRRWQENTAVPCCSLTRAFSLLWIYFKGPQPKNQHFTNFINCQTLTVKLATFIWFVVLISNWEYDLFIFSEYRLCYVVYAGPNYLQRMSYRNISWSCVWHYANECKGQGVSSEIMTAEREQGTNIQPTGN